MKTQVLIYLQQALEIGGIETFVYNFCIQMKDKYQIIIMYRQCSNNLINKLKKIVQVVDEAQNVEAEIVIMNRLHDVLPKNVKYNKLIQMIHGTKQYARTDIKHNQNITFIHVSDYVATTYDLENEVHRTIHNITLERKPKHVLKLLSATRLTHEKGGERIIKLAEILNKNNIPFLWAVLSNKKIKDVPNGIIQINPTTRVEDWIDWCDYLVQLSDDEAFCYSIVEALEQGKPVITTPLKVLKEIGVIDGTNGFVVPFDMNDIDVNKIYNNSLKFDYTNHNKEIINQWCDVLGEQKPFKKYIYDGGQIMKVKVLRTYTDIVLDKTLKVGEVYDMKRERVDELLANPNHLIEVIEEDKPVAKEVEVEIAKPVVDKVEKAVVKKTPAKKKATK